MAASKRRRRLSQLSSKIPEKPGARTPGFFIFSAYLSPQISVAWLMRGAIGHDSASDSATER